MIYAIYNNDTDYDYTIQYGIETTHVNLLHFKDLDEFIECLKIIIISDPCVDLTILQTCNIDWVTDSYEYIRLRLL